jgi:hypothetical protein
MKCRIIYDSALLFYEISTFAILKNTISFLTVALPQFYNCFNRSLRVTR